MFLKILWIRSIKNLNRILRFLSLFLVAFYQSFLSGTLGMGGSCRFYPSCSDYALEAYKAYSFLEATKLLSRRLLKCHPFGPFYNKGDLDFYRKANGTKR